VRGSAHAFVSSSGLLALVAVSAVAGLFLGFDHWRASPCSSGTPLLAADVSPDRGFPPSSELPRAQQARVRNLFGNLPLYFVENQGQLDEQVRYYVKGRDKTLYFTSEGVTISLQGEDERWTVKLDFVDANPNVVPRGEEKQQAVFSYFKGKPEEWKAGCPTYVRVVYEDLWPGIDLVFRGTVNKLKHEFVVAPGADPAQIRIGFEGASGLRVDEKGDMVFETPVGSFDDVRPTAWQEAPGGRKKVSASYDLREGEYGFALGNLDPSLPLVLDPEMVVYCGYIGGSDDDEASPGLSNGIAVDGAGAAYVAGWTQSSELEGFPVLAGPDLTYNGLWDVFVAKVAPSGATLEYCGYIGGLENDYGGGIAVDENGAAYVTGSTSSSEFQGFPVCVGPDLTWNGYGDVFVAKIAPDGSTLEYCGYIGGASSEAAYSIVVDSAGAAYLSGRVSSDEASFPVLVGPDLTFNGGGADAFVAKVDPSGTALLYCGYVGGSDVEEGFADIAIDSAGAAYVTGVTRSSEQEFFPTLVGPDLTFNGDSLDWDAYVAKVAPSGATLEYCGYIGGTEFDEGIGIAVGGDGAAYVCGWTASAESQGFPVVVGPDLTFNGGADAFVAKVSASGAALEYCGYIGGMSSEYGHGIDVDSSGAVYVTGGTDATEDYGFPVLLGPDLTPNGYGDAFVAKVAPYGASLVYCGYFGGSDIDGGHGIAVDGTGAVYITGMTESLNLPTMGGLDPSHNGGMDGFVTKIDTLPQSFACRIGAVDIAASPVGYSVLRINGIEGNADRVVTAAQGTAVTIFMDAPPSGPTSARFALYVWLGEPSEGTVTPHPVQLGEMCFPTPLAGGTPQPKKIWNNIGKFPQLGYPDYPSSPAPSMVLSKPSGISNPLTATFQGFIMDDGSAANKPASITNAVILKVVE